MIKEDTIWNLRDEIDRLHETLARAERKIDALEKEPADPAPERERMWVYVDDITGVYVVCESDEPGAELWEKVGWAG